MSLKLTTKAQTLVSIQGKLYSAQILPLFYFSVAEWRTDQTALICNINQKLKDIPLIVRSSTTREDSKEGSMAGHFESVLGVRGEHNLKLAVDTVIASYGVNLKPHEDEVLIQPFLENVRISGVVFSHDPGTGAPYRVINYSVGPDTTVVTSGINHSSTFIASIAAVEVPVDMKRVISMVDELEALIPGTPLDIEFAFAGPEDTLYLLQARPLIMRHELTDMASHKHLLSHVADKVKASQQPHPFLHGRSTVFGVMPDWNPAEIIGIRPRPLSLSLYRELVTDAIWAYQRHNYGYRNLRSFPLLVHFHGQPYIDVRLSFNSFIPRDVDSSLAGRLVDYYIDRLIAAPALHDKIEFEIVFSCYTLDLPERLKVLADFGFTENDQVHLADNLRVLTNRVIEPRNGLWKSDQAKLDVLIERRDLIQASGLDPVSRIYWLLEDCKRYGTLPFAGLARAGFIAVQMLKSLVTVGVFDDHDYDRFMSGLNTVSSQLARDYGSLDRTSFLARYGHLRPGTYDILSPRYDEAPDIYLSSNKKNSGAESSRKPFSLSLAQMHNIARLLKEHGLSSDVVGLFDFLQAAIELREYAKFVFTRNLSDALSIFKDWGSQYGFAQEDLSYSNINCIYELYAGSNDPETILATSIEEGKKRYSETCQIWLPPLITAPSDVWAFHVPECAPNYVTQSSITGHVVLPEQIDKLSGGIVCIPSADPGFDWLFSHEIAGLVTAYGGVNSHMAIRANELGLPSVIGAGEALFNKWSQAHKLHIDCAGRRVEILS